MTTQIGAIYYQNSSNGILLKCKLFHKKRLRSVSFDFADQVLAEIVLRGVISRAHHRLEIDAKFVLGVLLNSDLKNKLQILHFFENS